MPMQSSELQSSGRSFFLTLKFKPSECIGLSLKQLKKQKPKGKEHGHEAIKSNEQRHNGRGL